MTMWNQRRAASLLLVLLTVAGCATDRTQPRIVADGVPGTVDCVWVLYIQNFDVIDPSTLIVYAQRRRMPS
jgi:hypothetical protein